MAKFVHINKNIASYQCICYNGKNTKNGGLFKMKLVLLTALGVGGATILGSVIGFLFKNITHKFSDLVLSFAAGVMLA